ncbi:hypothetical protein Rumeso_02566 [Rubellimicrobium mesophilum DSM 19309]|uniref:Uncharacterized protein n=1 Tax=Rubellimicrobium mesophilum DSM 19309 TaxID=442562 RepID=A0A017HPU1_9RHOB|nr:hypothetical protein [Rubellimicrobium mesophilum]EYD75784.1 hypothetical protein Rumeso_02566 [Rubellimicrobium mesophilum DSM 19309]
MIRPVLLLLALTTGAHAHGRSPGRTPTHDSGGSVILRAAEIRDLEARHEEKRLSGECMSACTMYLGLSTACFEPGTILGFHGPRLAYGLPMPPALFESVSRTMAAYYPPRVARRFMEKWRYSDHLVRIRADRLIARGEARACD